MNTNNLIWHIVKKDFRRLWLPVVLLMGSLVGAVVGMLAGKVAYDNPYLTFALEAGMVLFIASFLWLLLLVLSLFAEDPPLGEQAFWRTRPISGWQMFAAKAIFLGLITIPMQTLLFLFVHGLTRLSRDDWQFGLFLLLGQACLVATLVICTVLWRNMLLGFCCLVVLFMASTVLGLRTILVGPSFYVLWPLLAIICAWWTYTHRDRRIIGFLIFAAGFLAIFLTRHIG